MILPLILQVLHLVRLIFSFINFNDSETAAPLDALDSGPSGVHRHFQQFRILVIGRANAGKTTLLQRVCNTTEHPEVFDGQGNRVS